LLLAMGQLLSWLTFLYILNLNDKTSFKSNILVSNSHSISKKKHGIYSNTRIYSNPFVIASAVRLRTLFCVTCFITPASWEHDPPEHSSRPPRNMLPFKLTSIPDNYTPHSGIQALTLYDILEYATAFPPHYLRYPTHTRWCPPPTLITKRPS
jgi:hypothetical protein